MRTDKIECYFITRPADIRWLTGFTGSAAYLVITYSDALFITDSRYATYVKDILNNDWDVEIVTSYAQAFDSVAQEYNNITIQLTAPVSLYKQFNKNTTTYIEESDLLQSLRMVKSADEIDLLRGEYALAGEAFLKSLKSWQYNQTEQQWAATLEYNMKLLGATSPAFETIVASGERGALPHGVATQKTIEETEAVTVDFGSYSTYNSDYTRVVYDGSDKNILDIISIVKDAVEMAIDFISVGKSCAEIDKIARDYISKKGYGEYFVHSLGHGVGTEVHEMPTIGKSSSTTVQDGMVFTIEPGIYIPHKYGVRLEQTVVVQQTGCTLLSDVLNKYVYRLK